MNTRICKKDIKNSLIWSFICVELKPQVNAQIIEEINIIGSSVKIKTNSRGKYKTPTPIIIKKEKSNVTMTNEVGYAQHISNIDLTKWNGDRFALHKDSRHLTSCSSMNCKYCAFNNNKVAPHFHCQEAFVSWLKEEFHKPHLLDETEKDYVLNIISPFLKKNYFVSIEKIKEGDFAYMQIKLKYDTFRLARFPADSMYCGMEYGKEYVLKDILE